ncbi:hypothetical protein DFJ77DRAFT_308397 [Powellomyces hirtus]|nr:hypothetical protein DFJ77DRAFT_308397 [Powellomyces hirtus]
MSVPPEKEIKRESPVEKAVFRLLNAMTKGSEPPPAVSILLQTLEDAQLLSFCIDAVPYFPHALHYVLHPFTWTESDYNSFYGFFWCCLGALTLNIALMIFVGVQFQKGSFRWMWPLVLLRWLSVLLTTVLFEPLVSIFVMAINCSHDEAGNFVVAAFPEVTCTGAHIPAIILGCIGVLLIVPFGLLINYVFVECEPNSRDPHAKAHGYMELLYMLLKIILVVLEQVSKSRDSKIALLIMLPILITSYARYQPYINQYMNSIRIGNLLSAFFWAIGSLVCQAYDPGNSPVPLTILALCIPLAHAIGKGLVLLSHNLIVGRVIGNLKRKMEYDGRDIEGGKGVDALLGTLSRRRSSIIQSVVLDSTGDVTRSDYAASLAEARHNLPRRLDALAAVGRFKEVAANKKARPTPVFRCPEEVEISCRFLRDSVVDSAALEIMRALFNEGVEQYPKHAGLALSYAYHIATYDTDPSSATYYVEAAEANNPPLDVRFRIFMEKREHEQATHAEDLARSSFNVASYVEFQSLQNQAISSHLNSLMALKAFWQNLLSDQVNDNTIASYMSVMHTSQAKASNFYKRLNARYPNSKQLIRLYAKYAFTVQNNQELGAQLLSQADDIEFREQRTARNKIDVEGSIEKFEGLRRRSGLPLSVDTAQNIEPPKNEPSSPSRKGFRSHLMAIPGSMSGDILANPGGVDEESYKPTVEALFEESGAIHDNHPYVAATGGSALPVTNGPSRVSVMAPPSALSSDYESGAGSAAEEAVDIKRWKPSVAKSATSSITSNKDARKMKAQRVQMKANLLMSINRYTLSGRLWIIVLLGLLIANYNESSKMFRGPGTFLDTLRQETRARRICLTHSILVRR